MSHRCPLGYLLLSALSSAYVLNANNMDQDQTAHLSSLTRVQIVRFDEKIKSEVLLNIYATDVQSRQHFQEEKCWQDKG